MFKIKSLTLLFCLTLGISIFAQDSSQTVSPTLDIYPVPQQMNFSGNSIQMPSEFVFESITPFADCVKEELSKFWKLKENATLTVSCYLDPNLNVPSEGYTLTISSKASLNSKYVIQIEAKDQAGFFYAAKTLSQLIQSQERQVLNATLPVLTIKDFPNIPYRGVVEGFYSKPEPGWSHEGRLSLIRFFGQWKMNLYIYGPKDDPYHGFNGLKWREAYPEADAKKIRELVKVANENCVKFMWTLHPANDPDWKKDPLLVAKACVKKYEMMYELGVRDFGIFFDDAGGDANQQVIALNYINKEFIHKKTDLGSPFVMCPTQYNKGWSDKKPGGYLDIMGEKLDKDIEMMWTGNSVCCNITDEGIEWFSNRTKRPAFIWWNWPVQDYCRNHLLIGRTYGNQIDNPKLYSGFTSNPMNKSEASMIGLFSIADYTWNIKGFNSDKSWKDGIKRLFPACADAVQTFANHNSDQGGNYHGYRREESVIIQSEIQQATQAVKHNKPIDNEVFTALLSEFSRMANAPEVIRQKCGNERFLTEAKIWLDATELVGRAGVLLLQGYQNANSSHEDVKNYIACFDGARMLEQYYKMDRTVNKNGWQEGVKPASLIVMPFLELLNEKVTQIAYKKLTNRPLTPVKSTVSEYRAFSNVASLKNIEAYRDGKYVHMKRLLELIPLEPNEYIGLELPEGVFANYVHVKLDNPKASEQGIIEVSADGKKWRKQNTKNKGQELESGLNVKDKIRYFRYINTSQSKIEIKNNQFKFDVPANAQANSVSAVFDCDFKTAYILDIKKDAMIEIPIPQNFGSQLYALIDGDVQVEGVANVTTEDSINNPTLRKKFGKLDVQMIRFDAPKTKVLKIKSNKDQKISIFEIF